MNSTKTNDSEEFSIQDMITEGVELRRQVGVLQSLPDLIVSFDVSSGEIFFASNSTLQFLGLAKLENIEGSSFWKFVNHESKDRIEKELQDALALELDEGEDSVALNNGMPLMIGMVVDVAKGIQEKQVVSFKGTVRIDDEAPECICSIRLVDDYVQSNENRRTDVIASDSEERKASAQRDNVNPKHPSRDETAARRELKRVKFDDTFFNQVSDEGSSKSM